MKTHAERTVKVAELKARLSAYLRSARRGREVVICDRETPVARLVPYREPAEPLAVREPLCGLHDVRLPAPLGRPTDSLAALLEERQPAR